MAGAARARRGVSKGSRGEGTGCWWRVSRGSSSRRRRRRAWPPVGIHGTGIPTDFEAPWHSRLTEDLVLSEQPLLGGRDGIVNVVTERLTENGTERIEFMIDLFYQSLYYKGHKAMKDSSREQAWEAFLRNYSKDPEAFHGHLAALRSAFEAGNPNGMLMRIHRLSIHEGLACAVLRQYDCPLCPPVSRKFENEAIHFWHNGKIFSESLCDAIKKFQEYCTQTQPPKARMASQFKGEYDKLDAEKKQLELQLYCARNELHALRTKISTFAIQFGAPPPAS